MLQPVLTTRSPCRVDCVQEPTKITSNVLLQDTFRRQRRSNDPSLCHCHSFFFAALSSASSSPRMPEALSIFRDMQKRHKQCNTILYTQTPQLAAACGQYTASESLRDLLFSSRRAVLRTLIKGYGNEKDPSLSVPSAGASSRALRPRART